MRDSHRQVLDPHHAQHFEVAAVGAEDDAVARLRQLDEFVVAAPPGRPVLHDLHHPPADHHTLPFRSALLPPALAAQPPKNPPTPPYASSPPPPPRSSPQS